MEMDVALQILKDWLFTNAVVQPLIAVFVIPLSFKKLRQESVPLTWTRPAEVPVSHPLLEVQDGQVRYSGGKEKPLPKKFAIFKAWFFPVWFMAFSVYRATEHQDVPLQTRFMAMIVVLLAAMIPVLLLFRRLEPRWLKAHLAALPKDVK